MKKVGLLLLVLVLFSAFVVTQSEAGQLCWNLSPYVDIIKVSTTPTFFGHKLLNGMWDGGGGLLIPVTGTLEKNGTVDLRLSLHGAAEWSAAPRSWALYATLDTVNKEGTLTFLRSPDDFTNSGTLVRVNCTTLVPLDAGGSRSND